MSRGTLLGYTAGQCTDYVASVLPWVGRWGDAWQWLGRAKADGFATSSRPVIGSIAVWGEGAGASSNGHVGVVTGIQGNGLPIVSEMNAIAGPFRVDQRAVDASSAAGIEGYILPNQGATLTGITLPGLPDIPGITSIPTPSDIMGAAGALTWPFRAIGKVFETITSGSFWWRAGFVALGGTMVVAGLLLVARETPSLQNAGRMFAEVAR